MDICFGFFRFQLKTENEEKVSQEDIPEDHVYQGFGQAQLDLLVGF